MVHVSFSPNFRFDCLFANPFFPPQLNIPLYHNLFPTDIFFFLTAILSTVVMSEALSPCPSYDDISEDEIKVKRSRIKKTKRKKWNNGSHLSFKDAAIAILEESDTLLSPQEIVDRAIAKGILKTVRNIHYDESHLQIYQSLAKLLGQHYLHL
jgi:hypothetical protein